MQVLKMSHCFFFTVVLLCLLPQNIFGFSHEKKNSEERRATWLETRELEEKFKDHVYTALQQLVSEGLISSDVVIEEKEKEKEKRGRHQGVCYRKTKNGRMLPYVCWKEVEEED